MVNGIVLFSGGLDSSIAVHLLKNQGLSVKAVHFILPFYSGLGSHHKRIREYAAHLDVPLRIVEEGEEYLEMIRDPYYGFGKNANPCVDCRIHRLTKAKRIMEEEGGSFIATGEVAGQRPMSQRMEMLHTIEERSGVKGLLLRPLSAHLLPETKAELEGLVDRKKLWGISGRSRRPQLTYAQEHNIHHAAPAGGCILTTVGSSARFHEFVKHSSEYHLNDFKLLAYGRHFRINSATKFIVARNDSENVILEKLLAPFGNYLQMVDSLGPMGVIRGEYTRSELELCGSILARFSKEKANQTSRIGLVIDEKMEIFTVKVADEEFCERYRVN